MEKIYLSEDREVTRLTLYKRAIHLFNAYKKTKMKIPFRGPFRTAGLRQYRLSPNILNSEMISYTPDIVASNNVFWIAFELTSNPDSKESKLEKYAHLDYHQLTSHGLKAPPVNPIVLVGRVDMTDDGPYCQIILSDKLDARKIDCLKNQLLEKAIQEARGADMTALPELPFTLLPEMKPYEIRVGLAEQVIQLFDPQGKGKTVANFVKAGLERIEDKVPPQNIEQQARKVETQLNELTRGQLRDYIEKKDGVYRAKRSILDNPKSRLIAVNRIKEWAGLKKTELKTTVQTYLPEY